VQAVGVQRAQQRRERERALVDGDVKRAVDRGELTRAERALIGS